MAQPENGGSNNGNSNGNNGDADTTDMTVYEHLEGEHYFEVKPEEDSDLIVSGDDVRRAIDGEDNEEEETDNNGRNGNSR